MRIKLIDIGNSKGIRLPKTLISQYHLEDEISIEPFKDGLLIKSVGKSRVGWEKAFKENYTEDKNIKDWTGIQNKFDQEDWTW